MVSHEQYDVTAGGIGRGILILAILSTAALGQQRPNRFYPDDPLLAEPAPRPTGNVAKLKIDEVYDFLENSFWTPRHEGRVSREHAHAARDVNTLGDVPNSPWYTNRHYWQRMSLEELKRGPGNATPPGTNRPWRVISAKSDGVMPGFVIKDQHN